MEEVEQFDNISIEDLAEGASPISPNPTFRTIVSGELTRGV